MQIRCKYCVIALLNWFIKVYMRGFLLNKDMRGLNISIDKTNIIKFYRVFKRYIIKHIFYVIYFL